MLRGMKAITGATIGARDGDIGSVSELYFDDEQWTVRYLVVDTGGWLTGRKVLIAPLAVRAVDWGNERVWLDLTRDQIEQAPSIDTDKPVSRQHEIDYYRYYGWPVYWPGPYPWGVPPVPGAVAMTPSLAGAERADHDAEEAGDPHLRRSKEVIGYHIQASDDEIGHVEDFLVDDETWQIRYLVVDTSNWWFGKKVLVAPSWIDQVSWPDRKLFVGVSKAQIERAPAWDGAAPPDRAYEEQLHRAHGRTGYWRVTATTDPLGDERERRRAG